MTARTYPVFDGHNDTILRIRQTGRSFFDRNEEGHLDLPRAIEGGFAGGFFAVYIPNPEGTSGPLELDYAQSMALELLGKLYKLVEESNGKLRIVKTAAEIEACIDDGVLAVELHLEGAEPVDPDLNALEVYYAAGVRSIGITHSRENAFGHGVTFAFPSSPDIGPGLTNAGKNLVRRCNELGIVIDLSHLNEKGFWDVAEISEDPLVATHSNVHALTPHPRNLTVEQLDAIRESNGIVGLNFAVSFLRPDGKRDADMPVSLMVDHLEYLSDTIGIDRVALGSDYDGTTVPAAIKDAAGLPILFEALSARGFSDDDLEKLAWRNWVRVFRDTWRE